MSDQHFSLALRGASKDFGRGRKRFTAVQPLDLLVDENSAVGIIGESGSGKSTLARMIVGFDRPSSGTIEYDGRSVSDWLSKPSSRLEYRRNVQYVAQDTSSSFDPRKTLFEAVAVPLRILRGVTDRDEVRTRLLDVARELSLDPSLYNRLPHQLSGGQRQRFALARSLVVEPRLLICDEVVSALDVSVQGAVLNLIKRSIAKHRMGLLFVSHGLPATAFISSDLLVMKKGEVVETGSVARLVAAPSHPYTRELMETYAEPVDPIGQPEEAAL
jgi:ABC-type dipeptide/oligopeptide/nickel transport system ATPase subunit